MKAKYILSACLILFSGLTLFNCSKDSETSSKPSYKGDWKGKTSNNKDVYFRVNSSRKIDSVKVYVVVDLGASSCSGLYLYKRTNTTPTAINEDGTFEIELNGIQMSFISGSKAIITGKFTNKTNCSGNFGGVDVGMIICGSSLVMGTGLEINSFTWTASKQSSITID